MQLAEHLRNVVSLEPNSWAIDYEGAEYTWGQLASLGDTMAVAIDDLGVQPSAVIGWAAENTPGAVAALAGLILHVYGAATINPHLAPKILCREIIEQRWPVIVGDVHFWSIDGVVDAAKQAGSAGMIVTLNQEGGSVTPVKGLERIGHGPFRPPAPGMVIERLSSGTTGPPKRSPQSESAMLNALVLGQRKQGQDDEPLKVKRSPSFVFKSLAHAGAFATMLALFSARPIVLQRKFTVAEIMKAVVRYRPKVLSLVPSMIKMIWDAQVSPDELSSVIAIRSGTAPLDPKLQADFEARYGIRILIDYGATEFGGVTTWTMEDHAQFAESKRGSVGRAVKGVRIRVVAQDTGAVIEDGSMGILQVAVDGNSDEWISTTDLVTLDKDGFLYIHGRADDAIVRGGFKVLPDDVVKVLRQHPAVRDAAVVGVPDERLGAVPVAVIEAQQGIAAPAAGELERFARDHLTAYQVPVAFVRVEELPRSASMKVIKNEVLQIARRAVAN